MTALTNTDPNTTYKDLLQLGSGTGSGLTGSLQSVQDGLGNSVPIQFSTSLVNITALQYNGNTISIAGALTFAGANAVTITSTGTTNSTLPSGTHTLVGQDTTDTLTNKTITAPAISAPAISGSGTNSGTLTGGIYSGITLAGTITSSGVNWSGTFTGGVHTSGTYNSSTINSPTLVTPILGTPSSGTLTNCTGLPLTGLVSTAWTSFTPAVTGFSGTPGTLLGKYLQVGKLMFIKLTISGTSNTTGFTITNLPATILGDGFTCSTAIYGVDNGAETAALVTPTNGTTIAVLMKGFTQTAASWTNTGTKTAYGLFFYETA